MRPGRAAVAGQFFLYPCRLRFRLAGTHLSGKLRLIDVPKYRTELTIPMRKIFNDTALQEPCLDAGFVHVPMLSGNEIARLHSGLASLRPDDGFTPDDFGRRYHCSFLDSNVRYKRAASDLIKSVFEPHIARYLNGYRILNCNFYVKPPGTGEFPIHQNWPAIADLNDTTVTGGCPLQDVFRENGALQFVEGSHKLLPHVEGPTSASFFDHIRPELIQKYLKPQPMCAGEALIFDDGLIHWSASNDSDSPRIAIQILCVPVDSQPVYFYMDPADPDCFEIISVDCDFFIEQHMRDLTVRQPDWQSLGFVENRNRFITEKEFAELLSQAHDIREKVYASSAP